MNKFLSLILSMSIALCLLGCSKEVESPAKYNVYDNSAMYGITSAKSSSNVNFFAKNLCVIGTDDVEVSDVDSFVASSAGAFNIDKQTVNYAQSVHEKMYPASTTKIMTAYVACLYGDLDEYYTVSPLAVDQASDSSVCELKAGDVISLRDLLYGLMLRSGNDAAIAIAEGVSGDVESFVELMNKTAQSIGATNTNFVNPNGLHDENHYTSVYDMYLMLNTALDNPDFYSVFTAKSYTANYTSAGAAVTKDWNSTNQYLSGNINAPKDFTILGGKTGTTGAAGYCLVLLSENPNKDRIISIVFNADCRSNLYLLMNEVLSNKCR
ncbi:MAG: serine hydrolase [Pseudobutyrivibrio sp.]|nr:serine hydrolase [Pseudobutyrivibrio sp.]